MLSVLFQQTFSNWGSLLEVAANRLRALLFSWLACVMTQQSSEIPQPLESEVNNMFGTVIVLGNTKGVLFRHNHLSMGAS